MWTVDTALDWDELQEALSSQESITVAVDGDQLVVTVMGAMDTTSNIELPHKPTNFDPEEEAYVLALLDDESNGRTLLLASCPDENCAMLYEFSYDDWARYETLAA